MGNKILNIQQIVLIAMVFFTYSIEAQDKQLWEDAEKGYLHPIGHYKNVNLNIQNEDGQTPLMIAVKNKHTNVVRAFAEGIVDISMQDFEGKTAYEYIQTFSNHPKERRATSMYGALMVLEVRQIVRGKAKVIQYSYKYDTTILQITIKGAQCNAFLFPEKTKCRALKAPSKHEIFKAIKAKDNVAFDELLLTVDDLSIKNKSKYTLLWASIHYKNYYALEQLLDAGADMNELDQNGLKTPVYWATMTNNVKLLKVLLKHGADVNSKDLFGSFALTTWAFKCNNFEAIKILLDNGANPYLKDERGKTAFDKEASFCKNPSDVEKMKKLLKEHSAFSPV